ncbi:hypothetical protein HPB50_016784 [Hyalomma asiaticum]|uniref:Uncharacterized protein n=1 Tax=Hyalomma asiaticum TaxID=266040 RepID=A0ACB7STG3_HYAAI|nr:hypothetical protein HPB50_016784 [Hyalomma asiaticum]
MENLGDKYRDIYRKKATGQGGITWKFYWELHQFLSTLPANDSSLVDEPGCRGETVDEIVRHMVGGTPPPPEPPVSSDGAGDVPSLPASPFTADMEGVTPPPGVDLNSSEETSGKVAPPAYKQATSSKCSNKENLLTQFTEVLTEADATVLGSLKKTGARN